MRDIISPVSYWHIYAMLIKLYILKCPVITYILQNTHPTGINSTQNFEKFLSGQIKLLAPTALEFGLI